MASINFLVRGKKNPTNITCRFSNGTNFDYFRKTQIIINPAHWDKKNQKVRKVLDAVGHDEINLTLDKLKVFLIDRHNKSYREGEVIDKYWLDDSLKDFFNRPNFETKVKTEPHRLYYSDFADWWLENKSQNWLVSKHKFMDDRERGKYKAFVQMVKDFEGPKKIRLKDTTNKLITNFVISLNENGYASSTITRHVSRFRFFCLRAIEQGLTVNREFEQRVFTPEQIEIKRPYFNEIELEHIFKYDFSHNPTFDNVRDNLIISCWTGLRVSDFLGNLNLENFIDDFIDIKNTKTKKWTVVPVHPQIKKILIKRNGQLPKKISDQKYNAYLKLACKEMGFNSEMLGSLKDPETNRNVTKKYKKWELVSSHIGRRSFATNLYGQIDNSIIMAVCGWSKSEMLHKYIQRSNVEYANKLKKFWDNKYQETN